MFQALRSVPEGVPRRGIAGSHGHSVFGSFEGLFSTRTAPCPPTVCGDCGSPRPHQCLCPGVLTVALVLGVTWHLLLVLVCVFLIRQVVASIFPCACWPFVDLLWRKTYLSLCTFLNWVFFIVGLQELSMCLGRRFLADMWFATIFSHSIGCLFTLLIFVL